MQITGEWVLAMVTIALAMVAGFIGYGRLDERVNAIKQNRTEDIERLDAWMDRIERKIDRLVERRSSGTFQLGEKD